ncbi:hypothetical protein ACYSNU_18200 [Enterococcus sp. LJL120]
MKKIIFPVFFLIFLVGCSPSTSNLVNDTVQTEIAESSDIKENLSSTDNQENSNHWEEEEKIAAILTLSDFDITILSDNSEKRILLFTKDNQKYYKSIFVKSTKFLKIIDLKNNDTEIFYGGL